MRNPKLSLIITFIIALALGYVCSWGLMLALQAEYRFYGFGTLTLMAVLFALLAVFALDGPLNLGAFRSPAPDEKGVGTYVQKKGGQLMIILSLTLVRGIIGFVVGTVIGMTLAFGIRIAMGLPPMDAISTANPSGIEVAAVVGALFGTMGFLIIGGVLNDWFKWMAGKKTPMRHGLPVGKPAWTRYFNVDYDHKVIGIQYTVTGIVLLLLAGSLAIIFRLELAQPGLNFLTPDRFNTFMSAHGMIMIGSILLGVGGLMNYLVPLMIGASDMAFPRLNAFGYWINVPGILLLSIALIVGGWDTGWTGYPPLSAQFSKVSDFFPPIGISLFMLGVYLIGLSSIVGSANLLVTVSRMRAPGMSLFRMPIFVWAAVATSIIQLTATQLIGLSFLMVVVQRLLGFGFFNPFISEELMAAGVPPGDPILFQHLFWFYSHPAVYVFILPGLGIISELLPVFSRKPLFGYKWIAMSSLAIALIGFLVWAHHMFISGMNDFLRVPFMYSTMLVAVPTGVKFFSWLGTMWQGKLTFPTPMLFTLGAISVFLIGGLSGPINATVSSDMVVHDTYFVVGHFHATMFGGFVFPFFAALYYWFPKATGKQYNEFLGKVHFWMMTPAFWVMSLGQMWVGLHGMRRRIVDYDPALNITTGQMMITIAAFVIGTSVLIALYNFITSARSDQKAADNPWRSRSPEWQIPSPVPIHNYSETFQVVGEPYDYGVPGSTYVNLHPRQALVGGVAPVAASE